MTRVSGSLYPTDYLARRQASTPQRPRTETASRSAEAITSQQRFQNSPQIPKDSIVKIIEGIRTKISPPELINLFEKDGEIFEDAAKFIEPLLDTVFKDVFLGDPKNIRMTKITHALFYRNQIPRGEQINEQDIISKLTDEQKKTFDELKRRAQENKAKEQKIINNLKGTYKEVYKLFSDPKFQEEYKRFLDTHRQDPDKAADPHPKNIRVSAAVSQNAGSFPPDNRKGEKVSPYTQELSNALKSEKTMDDAINKVDKKVFVRGEDDGRENPLEPAMQKAVSTRRENKNAWKKADNGDENIRRIVIAIAADDGSGDQKMDAEELIRNYRVQSAKEYNKAQDSNKSNQFRADKVIYIKPLTKEEEARGITMKDKIEGAFKEAQKFVQEERQKAPDNGKNLKFEGITHWFGHGMTQEEKDPKGDAIYEEGSKEFYFITGHGSNQNEKPEGIDETTMKKWERQYLSDFRYFIQTIEACGSGAAI